MTSHPEVEHFRDAVDSLPPAEPTLGQLYGRIESARRDLAEAKRGELWAVELFNLGIARDTFWRAHEAETGLSRDMMEKIDG